MMFPRLVSLALALCLALSYPSVDHHDGPYYGVRSISVCAGLCSLSACVDRNELCKITSHVCYDAFKFPQAGDP